MLDQNNRPSRWEVLDTRQRAKDHFIDLRTDKCRASNGDIVDYHVLSYPDWVNMVAFDKDCQLILVDEYRHGIGEAVVGLPGGALDKEASLSPEVAAKHGAERELLEETGYAGSDAELLAKMMPNPAIQDNWAYTFITFNAVQTHQQQFDQGNGEFCVTVKRDFVEVLQEIADNRADMQAMHIAALWSAANYIAKSKDLPSEAQELQQRVRQFLLG